MNFRSAACLVVFLLGACRGTEGDAPGVDSGGGGNIVPDGDAGVGDEPDAGPVPNTACDPYEPRDPAPQLFIGPTGMEDMLLERIDSAEEDLAVLIYDLTRDSFIDAFIAAHERGVHVRVLVDGDRYGNDKARSRLTAAGVEVRDSPASFTYAHAKVIVLDEREAVIMSSNLDGYSMSSERNYGVLDRDPEDVADALAVFDADWEGGTGLDLSCTRLLVSPVNARERILGLVNRATETLDLAVMYVSDEGVFNAIRQRAAAGVTVRVLLASPGWITDNAETASDLAAHGIAVRYLESYELHAKLIISDGVAFVGSENLSWTSLNRNREVGVLVTEEEPSAAIAAQFESDWDDGIAP